MASLVFNHNCCYLKISKMWVLQSLVTFDNTNTRVHMYKHAFIYIYIHICMFVCVCVCVCMLVRVLQLYTHGYKIIYAQTCLGCGSVLSQRNPNKWSTPHATLAINKTSVSLLKQWLHHCHFAYFFLMMPISHEISLPTKTNYDWLCALKLIYTFTMCH